MAALNTPNIARFYKLPADLAVRRDLKATDKVVFAAISDRIGKNGYCWPGVRTIAVDSGLTKNGVLKSLKRLEQAGLLAVERRGNGRCNHYRKTETSQQRVPVNNINRSTMNTTGGPQRCPEPVNNVDHNQTDQLNQTKKGRQKKQTTPKELVFPEILDTATFRQAWGEWQQYLCEKKKKLTSSTAKKQLKKLAQHGADVAAAMIEQSIEQGWQGLFELKQSALTKPPPPEEIIMPEHTEEEADEFLRMSSI